MLPPFVKKKNISQKLGMKAFPAKMRGAANR